MRRCPRRSTSDPISPAGASPTTGRTRSGPPTGGTAARTATQFPSASEIEYIALDLTYYQGDSAIYPGESAFIDSLIADDGEFEVIFEEDNVIVARRVKPGPDGEPLAPNCPGVNPLAPPVGGEPIGEPTQIYGRFVSAAKLPKHKP